MKNIITISGDPVSGKGTVVNHLKKYYEESGYNVHVISVGHLFRDISLEMYKREHPEIDNPTIEQVNNDERFAEKRKEIDLNLDSYIAQKGKEVNENAKANDVYIFDSRLAFSNIENAFSIRLTVDEKVAGERVFNDIDRGREDSYETVEQAIESTKRRKEGEIARYIQRYGVDLTDENNYNLIINTSYASPDEITEVIRRCLDLQKQGKPFAKTWANPRWFLPLQNIRSTCAPAGIGLDLDEFEKKIIEEGYKYDCPIKAIQVDGYYYIIEGHHRNFAAGSAGLDLIPYDLIAKDDELIPGSNNTARERIEPFINEVSRRRYLTMVYDHEELFPKVEVDGEKRSYYYTDIYGKYPEEKAIKKDDDDEIER
ncbi:MAG: cytidylate kinase family protein [Clostridia bacterium]|nr:cytidylate kinase family protein [Clostridia bacterium]